MKRSSKQFSFVVVVLALLAAAGTSLYSQTQTQNQPPSLRSPDPMRCWTGGTTLGTNSLRWLRIFPKTSATSSCTEMSAPFQKIFSTPPHLILC